MGKSIQSKMDDMYDECEATYRAMAKDGKVEDPTEFNQDILVGILMGKLDQEREYRAQYTLKGLIPDGGDVEFKEFLKMVRKALKEMMRERGADEGR